MEHDSTRRAITTSRVSDAAFSLAVDPTYVNGPNRREQEK